MQALRPKRSRTIVAQVGDKVQARYFGRQAHYPATITKIHRDGTYNLKYDDGAEESHVKASYVKLMEGNPDTTLISKASDESGLTT